MAGRLAAVPEESMDVSTAAYPPRSLYRDMIRRVAVSGTQIRSTLFSHSQSGHSGSSYSSDSVSHSYPSSNSGYSGSPAAVDLGDHELSTIARRMVSDGYTQRMVQAFSDASPVPAAPRYNGDSEGISLPSCSSMDNHFSMLTLDDEDQYNDILLEMAARPKHIYSDDQDHVLETWFSELGMGWVLQFRQEHDSQWQLRLQHNSGLSLEDLVESWIRGLTVIVHIIRELQSTCHEMSMAVKRFGEASIFKMYVFVDAMVPAWKAENLQSVLDMYTCVRKAMENYAEDSEYLSRSVHKLKNAISSTMEKVKTLVEYDELWAIEIPRGGGEVHKNTRWIVDCIVSLGEVEVINSCSDSTSISAARDGTIGYLKDLLVIKSELCSDPSLRYLFLLNNFYFAAQMIEQCQPRPGHDWKLTSECDKYMDSYLDVSWGHVVSCIPKSHFARPLHRWINTSPLVKFESAFNKTYQAQKFWKVPGPQLRDALRRAITERVISSYRDYLNEHPELAEHVSRRNSTPDVLEQMLGELFEG